jgi:hypothetical protein
MPMANEPVHSTDFQASMRTIAIIALAALSAGCRKEAGTGGRAEITGSVWEQRYGGTSGQPTGEPYPLAEARVYIQYGDSDYPDDDTRTGPDGQFHFPWLRKGSYRIYVMSECNAYSGCTEAIYRSAEITGRKEVVGLDRITVRNY